MSGVDLLLSSGPVSALGWTLVHLLWQGCIIAVLYWMICALSRPESALLRYWSGIGALSLSLLALVWTFAIYLEQDAVFITPGGAPESVQSFLVLSGTKPDFGALLQDGIEPALPLIVVSWFAGVLALTLRTTIGWFRVRRLVCRGVRDAGDRVRLSGRRLERELGLRRAVRVLQSTRIVVPMAVGWLRPIVLIPAAVIARLPHQQLEMVLAHELAHIRRFDHVVNWLQIVVETLLFYHPAIRWVSRRIRDERETCCDDLVVARCRKPVTYARALANLEMFRGLQPARTVLAATGGNLLGRIRRIIDSGLPRPSTGCLQIALMAALAMSVALGSHQGVSLSHALHQVARVAQLQPSAVEWKTWGRSRAVWGAGLGDYARRLDTQQHIAGPAAIPGLPEIWIEPMTTVADERLAFEPVPQPAGIESVPAVARIPPPVFAIEPVRLAPAPEVAAAAEEPAARPESAPDPVVDMRLTQTFEFGLDDDAPRSRSRRRECALTGRRTCSRAPSSVIVVYVNPPRERVDPIERNYLN